MQELNLANRGLKILALEGMRKEKIQANRPQSLENPATLFLEWKAGKGVFQYYDKELETNIEIPKVECMVLDTLATVRGWDDSSQSALIGTEVRNTKEQPIKVRSYSKDKNGDRQSNLIAEGFYKDLKNNEPVLEVTGWNLK